MLRSIVRPRTTLALASRPTTLLRAQRPALGLSGLRFNSSAAAAAGVATDIKTEIEAVASYSPTAVETITEIATKVSPDEIGYFQSIGLAQNWYWPPDLFQHIFEYAHIYTGLPWWATIAVVTVGMRVAMLPMYYKASDTTARFSKLQPEMQKILEEYQATKDPLEGQKALLRRKKLMAEHNIKYRWLMAPLMGAPFFIGIFAGLNRMAAAPVQGFLTEGLAWFSDLSAADPYLGLQVVTALIYSATFKLGGEMGGSNATSSAMRKIMPWLPFIAIPVTMKIAAGTCLYFCFNGVLSLAQAAAFQSPAVRKALGMAPMVKKTADEKAKQENTIQSIKTMFNNMAEKAQENAERARAERLRDEAFKAEQKRAEERQYIKLGKKSKLTAANEGKTVKKGKELRM
ncbi:mitochondrial inner membrane protein Oxa1p [Trichomonascus vanleenenianus]|uniref:membrane insertase OXA1 n=1 Tax=Trichomonascus vanleenenianus TaxID=2268995 RepID=UPI003ECA5F86